MAKKKKINGLCLVRRANWPVPQCHTFSGLYEIVGICLPASGYSSFTMVFVRCGCYKICLQLARPPDKSMLERVRTRTRTEWVNPSPDSDSDSISMDSDFGLM